jgi:glutathione S-transferase
MKLYYAPGACSLADHIALIESGLPFETEKVDLKTKRTASGGDYTKVNPKGYVPALGLEGGETLTENIAILSYIADKAATLMPAAGMPHWRVLETTAFVSTELHKNFKAFFTPTASDEEKAAAGDMLTKRFALVEDWLGDGAFIVGEEMSIADCYLFVMLFWAKTKVGLDLPPHLSGYYERLKALPSVARALADEGLA